MRLFYIVDIRAVQTVGMVAGQIGVFTLQDVASAVKLDGLDRKLARDAQMP